MAIEFSPKQEFQTFQKDSAEKLHEECQQKWFKVALAHAVGSLMLSGATESELNGVRRFVTILINLGEKPEKPIEFPKKELSSYDNPAPPPKPKE